MSTEVNKAFVQQFKDNLIHLAQQKGSKLASTVKKEMVTGKSAHFERLGATAAVQRTSRHGDTPLIDTPHSRRRVTLLDYEWADLIDHQDKVRMLIDPQSDYALAGARALGRKLDDIIIGALEGNASSIDSSDSASSVALVHTIDEDFNTANSDIIMEKVVEAKRILMSNEVDTDMEELYFVLDSTALHNLLKETEVSSADYNTVKSLVAGSPGTFMGFNFIQSERLTTTSESFKRCLAYAKSGAVLAMGQDITARISERDDKSYATQVYASMTAGATRLEEEKVIAVEAYRT